MKAYLEQLWKVLMIENPVFILMFGLGPVLAVTTSAENALGMGVAVTIVLVCSNLIISAIRKLISKRIRILVYVVIAASFVTMVQLILQAYFSDLYTSLGIYLPLIVVSCLILQGGDSSAFQQNIFRSGFDGLGNGVGFTLVLTFVGILRELLGAGSFFHHVLLPETYHISIFLLAPGAFFTVAGLAALQNYWKRTYDSEKEQRISGECNSSTVCVSEPFSSDEN